jgi:hypothetical protein
MGFPRRHEEQMQSPVGKNPFGVLSYRWEREPGKSASDAMAAAGVTSAPAPKRSATMENPLHMILRAIERERIMAFVFSIVFILASCASIKFTHWTLEIIGGTIVVCTFLSIFLKKGGESE